MPGCPHPPTPELSAFGDGWAVTPHTWCAGHHVTSPKGTCIHPNLSWGGKVNPVKPFKAAASSWVHPGALCGRPARALRVTTVDTGAPGPRAGLGPTDALCPCSGVSLPQGWPHRLGCVKRLITEDATFSPCADKWSPCRHAGFCGKPRMACSGCGRQRTGSPGDSTAHGLLSLTHTPISAQESRRAAWQEDSFLPRLAPNKRPAGFLGLDGAATWIRAFYAGENFCY